MEKEFVIDFTVHNGTAVVKANTKEEAVKRFQENWSLHPLAFGGLKHFELVEDSNETIINEIDGEEYEE